MMILNLLAVSIGTVLSENIVFSRLLGVSSFLRNTKDVKSALRHSIAVAVFITLFSLLAWIFDTLVFSPLSLEYMRTFLFVVLLCGGAKVCEGVLKSRSPEIFEQIGISFDEVCLSSAFLGVMLLCAGSAGGFLEALFFSVFSGAGYILSSVIFSAVRENLEYTDCPKILAGEPILFITLGLIALAFMGFAGFKFV